MQASLRGIAEEMTLMQSVGISAMDTNPGRLKRLSYSKTMAMIGALMLAGCGGSSSQNTVASDPSVVASLPAPPAPTPANTYLGTQSPGLWGLSLDDSKSTFSYQPVTYPASPNIPVSGSSQASSGFLNFGQSAGASLGYTFEVQGRTAILRPGDITTAPVITVPQTSCYAITGRLRFQFIAMPAGPYLTDEGGSTGALLYYGSFVASTSSDGSSWQFANLQGGSIPEPGVQTSVGVSGPTTLTGTCKSTNGQAAIAISGSTVFNGLWAPNNSAVSAPTPGTISTLQVGPSGFFVLDQSDPTATPPAGGAVIGVVEPSSPLSTSAVAAGTYLGFLYEPANDEQSYTVPPVVPGITTPVAFGQVPGSGTTMTGGVFPNDDVTQTPNSDIIVNLGGQDTTLNGLYLSAAITVLDPFQNCANYTGGGYPGKPGINSQGYITCSFPAVAVVGNPEGKYAIFINSYNWAAQLGGIPMQLYLYQQ